MSTNICWEPPSRDRCSPRSRSRSRFETGCDALAHGCTGKGNDQVRFELTYKALAPHLPVIAPWREWSIVSREDAIEYAAKHNVPISQTTTKIYSRDRNIWHISHEGGALEDPANAAPDDVWMLTRSPKDAPDKAVDVTIGFDQGRPVSVNGQTLSAVALLEKLNQIGAEHGIGRIDLVENRFVGMKSRGCYETPGGTLIMAAHHELESLTLDRGMAHYKEKLALDYAEMVYNGLWFTPLRESLDAFFEEASQNHHRRSDAAAVQGQLPAGEPQIAVFAVLAEYRQLHHGRGIRPARRARLHQPDRPADSGAGVAEAIREIRMRLAG